MTRRTSPGWLTVPEILEELGIPRRTWQRWRALGRTPKPMLKLPNGEYRVRRSVFDAWLADHEVDA
ncbi:helix-turn-helix transcriptional regulator [Actinomadura litoris]|uniref:helix-turn-helix transcriptional regulator n=1 Tax=Actinomadura litoris TaxID=2678616 RepID=UPI001FA6C636|nr:helix-turn-helix domain-containing protein [Actinomadura litoris]